MQGKGKRQFKPWLQLLTLAKTSLESGHRRFLVASLGVHFLVVIAISWSWESTEAVKTYAIPASVQARVLSQKEVESLPYKLKAKEREALRQKKLRDEKKKRELAKKKAEEKKRKEAQKKAKAKKEAEKKRLLADKRKKEEAAKKKEELERIKKLEALEKADRLAKQKERKIQEQEKELKRAEMERLNKLAKARESAIQEKRLAERMAALNELQSNESSDEVNVDMDEISRFMSVIKSRVESRWFVPPNSSGRNLVLRIQLLPTGELSDVKVIKGSGNSALDQSALAAVKKAGKFEVPRESNVFEKNFRSFQMSFTPPE